MAQHYSAQSAFQWKILFASIIIMYISITWSSPVSTNNKYTQKPAPSSLPSSATNLNKLQTTTPIYFNDINRAQFTLKPAALNSLIKWVAANANKKSQPKLPILNNLINITNVNYKNTNNSNSTSNLIELSTESIIKLSLNQVLTKTNLSKNLKPNNSNNHNNAITSTTRLRESFVIPSSSDSELEAKILYEKSLKEYDAMEGRTLKEICSTWQLKKCSCSGQLDQITLKCRGLGLVEIPLDTPDKVVYLDLGNNNITHLPSRAFDFVPNLEELILSNNIIKRIDSDAFLGLSKLKRLSLQNCGITVLPEDSFQHIPNLVSLFLSSNTLIDMDKNSLKYFHNLRTLRLEGNAFYRIPTLALAELKSVEILNMGNNLLTIIKKDDFPTLPNLIILILKRNHIHHIEPDSFIQLKNIKILDLSDNLLKELPGGLRELTTLQELTVTANHITAINQTDLPKNLLTLDMRANSLIHIDSAAFRGLSRLRKLIMSDVRTLKEFPNLDGCNSLEIIRLDRAGIQEINGSLCKMSSNLRSLELKTNDLHRIPDLSNCKNLRLLDLSSNRIESLSGKPFRHLSNLHDLLLSYNQIKLISYDAFSGIGKLQSLDLEGNEIESIHEEAFAHFEHLEDLNLGQNIFPYLPSTGLEHLVHLKTFNNPKLKDFPNPEIFPRIRTLVLSYAYHCCPFLPLITSAITQKPPLVHEAILFPSNDFDPNFWNSSMADIWPHLNNLTSKLGPQINDILDSFGQDFLYPGNLPTYVEDYFDEDENSVVFQTNANDFIPGSVQCLPLPGPFLPCVDLFDWWTLRCGVWMVFLLALFGNGTVVFVLIFSRSKMDVPRFLVCNLAAADFFMGIYLGILAIVDASTFGHFRMYAIPWQMSIFCQIAGFLAVLSSELSVYTLAVITLERNYAITNAIHLNKRLTLKQAMYIMLFGWTFALTMASLPLVGVSDYRKFAICLPFETTTGIASLGYVIALMFINGCAFLTLMGCYLKMYWAIRGSQAWNTNDSRIAKRMALLVFTDFLCWSPIAFFSLTAICGLHLISLEQAKIFTVFILPLNSCCNPFLYAIMTKQFKKDCITLCKSIEETRATKANAVRVNDKRIKELPPLLPNPHIGCRCLRMLPHEMPRWQKFPKKENIIIRLWNRVFCRKKKKVKETKLRRPRRAAYNYQFTDVKASIKKPNRASSISSENFCSSRSSSWRNGTPTTHNCSIPLKVMDPNSRRRHSAWLITRKTSQDSNLSSSRNDSSASATTASTSTFRLSRSSASSATPTPSMNCLAKQNSFGTKPKLVRQQAVVQEEIEITGSESSSPRLGVRFLPTIPSAADSSVIMEDNSNSNSNEEVVPVELYAVLQNTGNPRASLSSPNEPTEKPP